MILHLVRLVALLVTYTVSAAVLLSVSYCWILLAVSLLSRQRRNVVGPVADPRQATFCILVPAHNEQAVIADSLERLTALSYPASLYRVVVIADNCTDTTASIARRYGGVDVMERFNDQERGKGYALNWAIDELLPKRQYDIFAIVDADTWVSPEFLTAMNTSKSYMATPEGLFAAQGHYKVLNADQTWRTALMAGALSLAHFVRPSARERLGLTVGLKGNGMCFSSNLLEIVRWRGDSLTEDIDYCLDLLEKASLSVHFVPEAIVAAEMPTSEKGAASQRERWEKGRWEILRRRGFSLLWSGLTGANKRKIDAALDLIVPPFAEIAALCVLWGALLAVDIMLTLHVSAFCVVWIATVVMLAAYISIGFQVGGAPPSAQRALFYAPFYLAWKILLRFRSVTRSSNEWIRTERSAEAKHPSDKVGEP